MNKEITFTNWVRIGDQRVALNDLPKDQQQRVADSLIYRPLTTIADVSVVKRAAKVDKHRGGDLDGCD